MLPMRTLGLVLAALAVSSGAANAGIIDMDAGVAFPAGPPSFFAIDFPFNPSPNNDNTAAVTPNAFRIDKGFGAVGAIDLQLHVQNSGGTTEYFFDETGSHGGQAVINSSGVAWSDYHL